VIGIVGRFLEHTRIYYFHNGGDEEYFVGSADLMTRNLESRVEVLTPIEQPLLRRELRTIFEAQLSDRRNAWDMQPDGTYVQRRTKRGRHARGSQQVLIDLAERRSERAKRLRKVKPRAFARRAPK
jgi:polyphosphate kinase